MKKQEFKRIPMLPEFRVRDFEHSRRFYLDLGFEIYNERPEDKFALIQMQDLYLMIMQLTTTAGSWNGYAPMEHPLGRGMHLQMEVSNVDELYKRVVCLGIPLFRDMKTNQYREHDKMLKCKEFLIQDPDGYLLRFSTTTL
ncbi:MAG: VOC family protein [Firmicutes bacterium]|nr:VOC family protein [Bacillota bacterium]